MQRLDPFADLDKVKNNLVAPREVVSRAMNVIEAHDKRHLLPGDRGEEATRKANEVPGAAKLMLMTGSDEYIEAFRDYLNDPMGDGQIAGPRCSRARPRRVSASVRARPHDRDHDSGTTNPYRRIAEVKQTTTNAWQGVNSAGVGVAWLAEGVQAADTGSAVGQIQIFVKKAAAWVTGLSRPWPTRTSRPAPDAARRRQGHPGGAGVRAGHRRPPAERRAAARRHHRARHRAAGRRGHVGTAGGAIGGPRRADVYNLNAALGPRFRLSPNVAWVANITTINKIRGLDVYGGSSFWANLGADQPDRLLDKPILESPSLLAAGTGGGTAIGSAVAVFGDLSKFYIVDRLGDDHAVRPAAEGHRHRQHPDRHARLVLLLARWLGVATSNAFRLICNS